MDELYSLPSSLVFYLPLCFAKGPRIHRTSKRSSLAVSSSVKRSNALNVLQHYSLSICIRFLDYVLRGAVEKMIDSVLSAGTVFGSNPFPYPNIVPLE